MTVSSPAKTTPDSAVSNAAWILAVVMVVVVLAAVTAAWPLWAKPIGPIPRFLGAYASLLGASEVLGALLLAWRAIAVRTLPATLLAVAYCFSAPLVICNLITLPGVVAPAGTFPHQTPPWAWFFWHVGWAAAVAAYVAAPDRALSQVGRPIALALTGSLALVLLCVEADRVLPPLLLAADDHNSLPLYAGGLAALALLVYAAGGLLRKGHSSLDAWLFIAVVALALDIALTILAARRFSIGTYIARSLATINSVTIFLAVAAEYGSLSRRGASMAALQIAAESDREAAATLQRALLPEVLPDVQRVRLSAHYRPATQQAMVGGDWWDVFYVDDNRLAVSVGDVAGHGLPAAAAMIRLRQTFRVGALTENGKPAAVLHTVNRVARLSKTALMATAVFAVLDLRTLELEYGIAGHPPPLLLRGDGTLVELHGTGLPITIEFEGGYVEHSITLMPSDVLALYTDGLVEGQRDIERGMQRLRDVLRTRPARAEAIVDAVLGDERRDDVALLLLHVASDPRGAAAV